MESIEPKPLPSIEPPVDEVSSCSSNIVLNEAQENTTSNKKGLILGNSKRRKELVVQIILFRRKFISKSNSIRQGQFQGDVERLKDYVEERMIPFKNEIAKLSSEILEKFKADPNIKPTNIIKSIKELQKMHDGSLKKYAQLKIINNKSEAKLESQIKLNKHLEETLSSTIRERDDLFIQLKSEIVVLERKVESLQSKLNSSNKDESVIEQEWKELRERILENEGLLDMQIRNNNEYEEANKGLLERIDSWEKEMYEYKEKTQNLINNKNEELIDLRTRLSMIDQEYTDKMNVLLVEKNKLQSFVNIETTENELLSMKLAVLSNKIKTVIEQKGFLLENVESWIDNLKQEWSKLKEHCQKQMVISGKTAVQQLEELLVLMINSFEGVKDVIRFMSFEELEIVGFENKMINLKVNSNQLNDIIGVSSLDEQQSI